MRRALAAVCPLVTPVEAADPPTLTEVSDLFAARCVKCHAGSDAPMALERDSHGAVGPDGILYATRLRDR